MGNSCGLESDAEQSIRTLLLSDIRDVFAENGDDKISSAWLVEALAAKADRPWPECRKGKPINQNWLARQLGEFGICPKNVKLSGKVPKGYVVADFEDAFSRYLPKTPFQTATSATSNKINNLDENQTATGCSEVAVHNQHNQLNSLEVAAVAVQNPESGSRVQNDTATPNETDVQRFEL